MSDQPPVPPTQPTPPVGPPPAGGGGATWQGVEPVVERPTEAMPPVPPPAPPPAPPTEPAGPAGGGGGASKGLIAAIVVVVLAILGVGGFLLLGGDDDDDDARVPVERDDERDDEDEETTTTTEAEETTTTTEAEDETTTTTVPPDSETAPGFTRITDDTGTLVLEVPDTWTDVDGRPQSSGDLNVQAAPDVEAFRRLEVSGVSYSLLSEPNVDPDTTLDFLTAGQVGGCDQQPREDYDDGVFRGRQQTLTNCGANGSTLIVIVASDDAGQSVEVSTLIVPPDPVEEIHGQIVRSFNILR